MKCERTCAACKHNGRRADGTADLTACAVMEARDDVTQWAWAHWEAGVVDAGAPPCPGFESAEQPARGPRAAVRYSNDPDDRRRRPTKDFIASWEAGAKGLGLMLAAGPEVEALRRALEVAGADLATLRISVRMKAAARRSA
jgi:hypothetical protein